MAQFVRKNAFNNGGDFSNKDLRWYAKGVQRMMSRQLDDSSSWWFFAAIHGEYVDPSTKWYVSPPAFPNWTFISAPPAVPTSPLPASQTRKKYWNQCQHGSWYFLPWHRGYLMALEAQLRADIVVLGGPSDWALPYWNYFGGSNASEASIPPAFLAKQLDGAPNPLFVTNRYGSNGNGTITIPTPAWSANNPGSPNTPYGPVTDECMKNDLYTGSSSRTLPPGFGGPETGFAHSGSAHGNMESNPHDLVHVYTGGQVSDTLYGLMADPGIAALDPIFYLHHCNLDRMWAGWNAAGNSNPTSKKWQNGPSRKFVMPRPTGTAWQYVPKQVESLATLDYAYDSLPPVPSGPHPLAARLARLGAREAAARVKRGPVVERPLAPPQLLGASRPSISVRGEGTHAVSVRVKADVRRKVARSLAAPTDRAPPDRIFLQLENVTGTSDAALLGVYVNLGDPSSSGQRRKSLAGEVALFGLRRASVEDGEHAGSGLTFALDITRFVDDMASKNEFDADAIEVSLLPRRKLSGPGINVGRISIYREAVKPPA